MQKRKIGTTGLEVAPWAFGGNVFGWTVDESRSHRLLDAFTNAGFNLIDTADVYSRWVPGNKGGESETIIGNWLNKSGKRKDVIIATKGGSDMGDGKKGLSKKYLVRAVEDSLRRLQTDHIDLYQSHRDDPDTPQEETAEAYAQLIKEGKIISIGASNFTADRLKSALQISKDNGYPAYQCLQPEYNLYDREGYEQELEQVCLENQIGVINYYSLASGFLTGKYRSEADLSQSQRGGGVKKYMNERGTHILKALDEVAAEYNVTQAAIALAWLMARPGVTAPIASATSEDQLHQLAKAAEITLNKEAMDKINSASAWDK